MGNKMNWLKWPLEHYSISLLIIGILFVMGIYGMYVMPKDEFPHATIRQGVVVAVYPGASSEEVEQQVARPLERYLFTYGEVNRAKTTTTSQNGMCIVMVKLNDEVDNKDEVWSKIKHGLNNFKSELPSGVLAVVVNDDFGNTSALLIAIESDQRSYRELKQYSDDLGDRLRRIPSVANVKLFGEQKEQISLYIDRQRLQAYGIGQQLLFSRLQAQGITTMSGSISDDDQQIPIHVEAMENTEEEVANQIIFSDPITGKVVRVRDVARVVREYNTHASRIEQDGHPCVLLSMEMTPGNNVINYGREVDKVLDDFRTNELPDDVNVTRIADKPKVVATSIHDFLRDLLISMAIIILVMMVLFPLRSAIVAAVTIPLSTFVSVAVMYLMGIELNIITLAALIVVLGMIVDNSIVVIDGYLEYLGKGFKPMDAAIESARQYFMPMLLATICICAIFYPYLITMKGMFHDALEDFPITITINLMVSLILAVTIIPFLETRIIKPGKVSTDGNAITKWVQRTYDHVLKWTFGHPWLTIIGGIVIILLSSLIAPTLKIRLFPYADRDQFAVEIFLPEGKGLAETEAVADSVRHVLEKDERITGITGFIGCSSPRFMDAYAPQIAGDNFAQFIVNTKGNLTTLDLLAEYQPQLGEAFPNSYVKFKRLDYMEPTELEYRFYGDNLDSLHVVAERLMERMREMPEVEWVHTDYYQPYPIINVQLDPVTSAQLGITRTVAQLALSATSSDLQVGQIWEGNYEVPIVVKDDTDMTYSDVANLGIASPTTMIASGINQTNSTIPLRQIAKVSPQWSESRIVHRGGERCITVTGHFVQGIYTSPIEKEIAHIATKEIELPQGVRAEIGGEIEYGDEAMPQIIWGTVIAMIIVFFFLLFNFKKYGITTVCMAALALMIPGALIGLGLMNRSLGLTSIFGLITLMGMIMRNEILIFEHAIDLMKKFVAEHPKPAKVTKADKREYYRQYNEAVKQAAMDAGSRRMVPIFLTTATTAVGVVPMIIAQSSFWMAVGVTIFAGGIGSLIMVVTMLPVVYWKVSLK
jgi:multidrug efflux pump subunit AcrB